MKATLLLTAQHRRIERLMVVLANADDGRRVVFAELVEALLEHMVMEEAVFYWIARQPLVADVARRYVANGCARQTLTELMTLDPTDPELRTGVVELLARFSERNRVEDESLIPRMEILYSDSQLERLARKIEGLYAASLRDSDVDAA